MKELNYGATIQVGDYVSVNGKMSKVSKVKGDYCYVRVNRCCTLELPLVYSAEFKDTDNIDETVYTVYRE